MMIDLEAFDAREGEENIYRGHCGWDVHASTQWMAEGHTSISLQQTTEER